MNFILYFQELLILILEFCCFYIFSCSIFSSPYSYRIKRFLLCLAIAPIVNFALMMQTSLLSQIFLLSYIYFGIFFIFQDSFFNSFFILFIEYIFIAIIQTIPLLIISIFFKVKLDSILVQIIGTLLTLIISQIIVHFINFSFLLKIIKHTNIFLKAILANSFIILFGIVYYSKITTDRFFHYFLLILVICLLILFVNADVILANIKIIKQKKQLDAYHEYLPIVEQLIDHVRQTQHAHNNNIQAIRMLPATCKNYEELSQELIHYTDYLVIQNEPIDLLKINYKLIAGFLYSKIVYAQAIQKQLRIQIQSFYYQTKTPEYEIITMIGILVDNAIEASNEHETIFINLTSHDDYLVFDIKNIGPSITPEFINSIFQKGFTTKSLDSKNHGIGLYQLKKLSDTYHGEITVYNETIEHRNYLCFELKI